MDKKTVYWHLPGICYFGMVNHVLFDAMRRFPDQFRENYKIGSVYGTFPRAIWNGGRSILDGRSSQQEIVNIIKSYNSLGIPVRFTWTNVLLEAKHISDAYCNMIMDCGNNGLNQVLVNSPAIEDYIRRKYPGYKILSSTTKRILDTDKLLEELEKDYYLVVLDYDLNHNEEVIEKLLPAAERIEILVNETCQPNCPNREAHYRTISKCQLVQNNKKQYNCTDRTPNARSFETCMTRPQFMSNEDVDAYVDKGFINFKIVGRGLGKEFYIDSLIYYLVKPECRDFIRKHIEGTLNSLRSMQTGRK